MKKIVTLSLVAATATTMVFGSTASDLREMKAEIAKLKAEVSSLKKSGSPAAIKKLTKKVNEVKAHDAGDNIKWGVDLRTSIDNINYDMADGSTKGKNDLMATRLWLTMAYAPDSHNVFKGMLSYNRAFGADFGTTTSPMPRGFGMDTFDWVTNEALTGNSLKVRQAYWLYLGDNLFGADIPWTFSIGRRPSTAGFLSNLREDDPAQSPLGHIINVEFDGLSSKLDLSNVTGVSGMSFKICMGQGSTNAEPLFTTTTPYANDDNAVDDIKLAGFIFQPYDDGQFTVKTTAFKAFGLPDLIDPMNPSLGFESVGDMYGAAISVMVDGLSEDGFLADTKLFGSFAWSKTDPDTMKTMLGSPDSETGTSYWFGTQIPMFGGQLGLEYNHGSKYWRPFTYGEDSMIGSKLAARGDAFEVYYTYQLTKALSAQFRYTAINYDYSGSNGFFGSTTGTAMKIDDIKMGASMGDPMATAILPFIVEKAQDARFYLRYRF